MWSDAADRAHRSLALALGLVHSAAPTAQCRHGPDILEPELNAMLEQLRQHGTPRRRDGCSLVL